MLIMYGVLKELIMNHYNNGTLKNNSDFLERSLERNKENESLSVMEYELLKETIEELIAD